MSENEKRSQSRKHYTRNHRILAVDMKIIRLQVHHNTLQCMRSTIVPCISPTKETSKMNLVEKNNGHNFCSIIPSKARLDGLFEQGPRTKKTREKHYTRNHQNLGGDTEIISFVHYESHLQKRSAIVTCFFDQRNTDNEKGGIERRRKIRLEQH